MPCSCLKTQIPVNFKPLPEIPFCTYRKYRPEFFEALMLLNAAGYLHDTKPEPSYWNWTPEEIADWILKDTGRPEYRETFIKNLIDGKSVIFLEADKFPRISIRQFHIIKVLTAKIRALCNLDKNEPKRGISLPIRKPQTLYMWYKASHTGPTSYYMTPTKYFKVVHIIPDEQACGSSYYAFSNHWNRIPSFMPWCPHIMIGNGRKVNPMTSTIQKQNFFPKDHPYLLKEDAMSLYHLPYGFEFPNPKEKPSATSLLEAIEGSILCD